MKGSALALVAAVVLTSLLPEAAPPAPKQPGSPAPALTPGAGIATLPFYSTADFTAEWIEPGTERYARIHRVAPFSLTNQAGDTVTEQTLRGKIYIANFFFTSCSGICPRMMASLRRLQAALAEDDAVVLVSHTVMPSMD